MTSPSGRSSRRDISTVDLEEITMGLMGSREQTKTITNACNVLSKIGPPADMACAVEPVGVATITLSALHSTS